MVSPPLVYFATGLCLLTAGMSSEAGSSCGQGEVDLGDGVTVQAAAPTKGVADAVRRPATEEDLLAAVRALRSVRSSQSRSGAAGVPDLNDPRLAVLLGDFIALLGDLHAREFATAIDRNALSPDGLAHVQGMLGTMSKCAELRFADRGGLPAYQRSLELVKLHRAELEPLLLEGLRFPPPPVGPRAGRRKANP